MEHAITTSWTEVTGITANGSTAYNCQNQSAYETRLAFSANAPSGDAPGPIILSKEWGRLVADPGERVWVRGSGPGTLFVIEAIN
ncbi:MAG: hypothetical protein OXI46_01465 [Gemmatimonadota bacterium]|nr:hypothetical protein [Gemmatimonadota bacterium]